MFPVILLSYSLFPPFCNSPMAPPSPVVRDRLPPYVTAHSHPSVQCIVCLQTAVGHEYFALEKLESKLRRTDVTITLRAPIGVRPKHEKFFNFSRFRGSQCWSVRDKCGIPAIYYLGRAIPWGLPQFAV